MFRFDRAILTVVTLALGLSVSACSTNSTWDPTDLLPESVFGSKEKLKGDRKPVFPEGVPGVPEGVPSELIKGNQQAGIDAQSNPAPVEAAAPAQPAPAQPAPAPKTTQPAKPKPKPKTAGSPLALPPATRPGLPPPPPQSGPPSDHQWPDPSQTSVPTPKTSTY